MAVPSFTVSQVRVAATCPRIAYFDAEASRRAPEQPRRVTRLWKAGDSETACGTLFHSAIDRFNRRAFHSREVREALDAGPDARAVERGLRTFLNRECVNLASVAKKPPGQQAGFVHAVEIYMRELADIVGDALKRGRPAGEILGDLFGDRRRQVNATFPVGPGGEPVHVVGILDYVFYDWRSANHRILDYKLTPAHAPNNDLFQVGLYALMHNLHHGTKPDVGVLYLHPERWMATLTWTQVEEKKAQQFNLLASMAEWVRYDERSGVGLKPPGVVSQCAHCPWNKKDQCVLRLGPKEEGSRLTHWTQATVTGLTPAVRDSVPAVVVGPSRSWAEQVEEDSEEEWVDGEAVVDPVPPAGGSAVTVEDAAGGSPPLLVAGEVGLRVGATAGGELVVLPVSVLPTHVAVVGAAGGGKTWMAKVIAEEAVAAGVPVLAIDPQGDLVQFLRESETPGGDAEARRAFRERAEIRVWTPGTSHARRLGLDPVRLAGRGELAGIVDPARREEEWEGMLAVAAGQLVAAAKVGGEEDSQRTFLLQVLRSLAGDGKGGAVGLAKVVQATLSPAEVGIDDPNQYVKKTEREKLARKLNNLLVGAGKGLYSGGTPLDLDAMCQAEEAGRTPLNVVYLNAMAGDDAKQAFVGALAAEIYRWMVTSLNAQAGRANLLVYLDEARDFIPAGTAQPPAKGPMIRLFTQGRKYGVSCLFCTQSPRSVDYNVFGNCSTKLIGRLESAQDVERVSEWFSVGGGSSPGWVAGRKGAEAGSFVGRWPGMAAGLDGVAFRGRALHSLHEGAWSPDRLEREVGGSTP